MSRRNEKRASTRRKLAEWFTLGASAVVVLGVAGLLVREALGSDSPYVEIAMEPRLEEVEPRAGRWLLPVDVENRGQRTLQDFKSEIVFDGENGAHEVREIEIDFLGESSTHRHYVFLDADPRSLRIVAHPLGYRVD